MIIPDYQWDGNINLVSSLINRTWASSEYEESKYLTSYQLKDYDNIVFFIIDWLGYNWLTNFWKNSFLAQNLLGSITSIFPSTTASSVTMLTTWKTTQDHGIMAWNMWSKEFWTIVTPLPWVNTITDEPLTQQINPYDFFESDTFFNNTKVDNFVVTHKSFQNSLYNRHHNKGAKTLFYEQMNECFSQTVEAVFYNKKSKYIYSYWADFDSFSHTYWINSEKTFQHFEDIDYQFEKLAKNLSWTNTAIIVSADHWQIDIPRENQIFIDKEHPELEEMLTIPLAGEPRCQYCFVKKERQKDFKEYVKNNLSFWFEIYDYEEALENNLFWINTPSSKFKERFGDFVIIATDKYSLQQNNIVERPNDQFWQHWWATSREIFVPLIKIET